MAEAHDPTAAEFEEAMKRAAKEQPEMMMPLLATAVLSCLRRLEDHHGKVNKLAVGLLKVAQKAGVVSAPSAVAGAAAEVAGAPAPSGKQRVGANGEPLSPQEAAVEEMMDGAVVDNEGSGIAPPQAAGKPAGRRLVPQRPQIVGGGNGGGTRTGADGRILTPQEAEIEDMMDTAVVDNS